MFVSSKAGRLRWAFAACVLVLLECITSNATAAPGRIELTWNAPVGCPDREQVLASIRELMGDSVVASDVAVRVDVARIDARLVLSLALKTAGSSAERTMESTDCAELARGAALVVAFAAGSEAPKPEPSAAPTPVPSSKPLGARPTSEPSLAHDVKGSSPGGIRALPQRPALLWSASLALDSGTFPRTSIGGALAARLDAPPFAGGFEALVLMPQDVETAAGGGRFWGAALGLRPCASLHSGRLRVLPCLVADMEMMVAEGRGLTFRDEGIAWFLRFGAGGELAYGLGRRLSMVTGAWVLGAPSRPLFVIDRTVPIHTPGVWALRWSIGLEFGL